MWLASPSGRSARSPISALYAAVAAVFGPDAAQAARDSAMAAASTRLSTEDFLNFIIDTILSLVVFAFFHRSP